MDSEEFQQFSQPNCDDSILCDSPNTQYPSTQPNSFVELDEFHNLPTPSNLRSQRTFPRNPVNAQFSSQPHQQCVPNFSYQGLLNAPNVIYVAPNYQPAKDTQKRRKTSQTPETPPLVKICRWTTTEDIALTRARLHISCDADVGTGQKSQTLWNRILQVWRQNMGTFDGTRDSNALECRWGRLQSAINKFHGCYEYWERNKKSGWTLEDVKNAALRQYKETNKNLTFKHEECWEICRKNVKWCTQHLTKQGASGKQTSTMDNYNENPPSSKQTTPGSSSARVNDGSDPNPVTVETTNSEGTRPDGRKMVKDQKRRAIPEKVVADALGNLQGSLERQHELTLVEIELKKEREKKDYELRERIFNAEIELKERCQKMKEKGQKRKEQERMMEKDLTKLPPGVRNKYEAMQAQILKEWEKDGLFGEVSGSDVVEN